MPKPHVTPAREAPPEGEPVPTTSLTNGALEVAPGKTAKGRKSRRRFSDSEKLRLVKAADAAIASGEHGAVEALLRKEGIYSSHLAGWRARLMAGGKAGLKAQKPGRKPKLDNAERQLIAVTKENAALKRKLAIANAVIDLQKKAHEVLGLALPDLGGLGESS